jgi:hypothetical protein
MPSLRARAAWRLTAAATVAIVLLSALNSTGQAPAARELIVCGWDEVFILDLDAKTENTARPDVRSEVPRRRTWSWRAEDRADLPGEFKPLFKTTDECKPYDGGAKILITSSGGGVALVTRSDGRVLFYGRAANAHSAELLPNDRVAVAASHDQAGKGDRLIVFDLAKSNVEVLSEELPWGHGVVWDSQRNKLWALGNTDIRVFELRDWSTASPKLQRLETIALPESGGHNLSVAGGNTPLLAVSTSNRCWLFDRDRKTFQPHPELGDKKGIKSISYHPSTGQIAYVQMEGQNWWAERIHFLNPAGYLHVGGEHFYKARWNP